MNTENEQPQSATTAEVESSALLADLSDSQLGELNDWLRDNHECWIAKTGNELGLRVIGRPPMPVVLSGLTVGHALKLGELVSSVG